MSRDDQPQHESGSITIDELQRDALLGLLGELCAAAHDKRAREEWSRFASEVVRMEISTESAERLGRILEAALTSGRVNRVSGRPTEFSLVSLYKRTPQAQQIEASLAALNSALVELRGQSVAQISAAQRAPGVYALTIATDGCRLMIRLGPQGAVVESVEVPLG
jgi:hypothetical protein